MTLSSLPQLVAVVLFLAFAGQAAADPPRVVVTIQPLHSLVSNVMDGVAEPKLLLEGKASPHDYALKPSDAAALAEAQLVVWVGEGLERFLEKPLETLAGSAKTIELLDQESLIRLPLRDSPEWHRDESEAAHDHDHGAVDPHLWLAPENARRIAAILARELAALDPANAQRYRQNAAALDTRLAALDQALAAKLAPVADKPYLVFHDAYQYFEDRYGLSPIGAVAINPEVPLGAASLAALEERVARRGPACLFTEPQHQTETIEALAARGQIPVGTLDDLGAGLNPGPEAYFLLLESLAESLARCLARGS